MYKNSNLDKKERGFTIVEVLVVASVMVIILAIGASSLSSMSVFRRSVDETTSNIASLLQIGKLHSVRDGVEYRLVFAECEDVDESEPACPRCDSYADYSPGDESIGFTLERGDSNRGSETWCIQSSHTRKFRSDLVFTSSDNMGEGGEPAGFTFLPTGMRRDFLDDTDDELVTISPASGSRIDKCGIVSVSPSGNISVNEGKWVDSACSPIRDAGAGPAPGPTPGPG